MARSSRRRNASHDADADTPLLEWIFGGLGLALFVGALCVTVLNGMTPDKPPLIITHAESVQPAAGRFRVEFEARNTGDQTAAQIQLVAILKQGDAIVEQSDIGIDFLPPHSSRRAGAMFDHDPHGLTVEIKALSYQHP